MRHQRLLLIAALVVYGCGRTPLEDPLGSSCPDGPACGPANQTCDAGTCACAAGSTACAGACVQLDRDPLHCGGCARRCSSGEDCVDGACVPPSHRPCPSGQLDCPPGSDTCV